jgi:hypothetical protein
MLDQWLRPKTLATFRSWILRRHPCATRICERCRASIQMGYIGSVLTVRSSDLLVVTRGKLLDVPRPTTSAELRSVMQNGVGIVLRQAERDDAALAEVALHFRNAAPSPARA